MLKEHSLIRKRFKPFSTVDPDKLGTFTVTYEFKDAEGKAAASITRTVHVVDLTPLSSVLLETIL